MVRRPLTNLPPPAIVYGVQCAGLVTDGSVRDTAVLREYGGAVHVAIIKTRFETAFGFSA